MFEGSHVLTVELRSSPGAELELEMFFAAPVGSETPPTLGERGLLELGRMMANPPVLTPNSDGLADTSFLNAVVRPLGLPGLPSARQEFLLRSEWLVVERAGCEVVATLQADVTVESLTSSEVGATWDGMMMDGQPAPDGEYLFWSKVALVRKHGAKEEILDTVESPAASVSIDTSGPRIVLLRPSGVEADGVLTHRRGNDRLRLAGYADDATGVASVHVLLNGIDGSVPVSPLGAFYTELELNTEVSSSGRSQNLIVLQAVDDLGLRSEFAFRVDVLQRLIPGEIEVRFSPEASSSAIEGLLDEFEAQVIQSYGPLRLFHLRVSDEIDTEQTAYELSQRASVAYALPVVPGVSDADGFCSTSEVGDTWRRKQWYLQNETGLLVNQSSNGRPVWCEPGVGTDCANGQVECILDYCYHSGSFGLDTQAEYCPGCTLDDCFLLDAKESTLRHRCRDQANGLLTDLFCEDDSDCGGAGTGTCTVVGTCGRLGGEGFDIGWGDSWAEVCGVDLVGPEITIAIIEASADCLGDYKPDDPEASPTCGLVDLTHPDLSPRAWTNTLECCGDPNHCPDNDDDGLPDCRQGEAVNVLSGIPDHYPGKGGVDDDGDSFRDFDDPDVQRLIYRICTNGHDDTGTQEDDDCICDRIHETCSVIPQVVYWLAAEDDDENGYIDDVHGVDLVHEQLLGVREASTHSALLRRGKVSLHATRVAGVTGAELDNDDFIAGIHPRARLMTVSVGNSLTMRLEGMRYASAQGAELANLSAHWPSYCGGVEAGVACEGDLRTYFESKIGNLQRSGVDAFDPAVLYVASAGNDADDLSKTLLPLVGEQQCPTSDGRCYFRWPQHLGFDPDGPSTRLDNFIVVAATNMADELAGFYIGETQDSENPGTNIGTPNSEGSSPVDIGAPGDAMVTLSTGPRGFDHGVSRRHGTSFAAPVATGIAAMVASRFSNTLRHHPAEIRDQLLANRQPCQPSWDPALRGCEGSMGNPGRVDLYNAMRDDGYAPGPWLGESHRLQDLAAIETNTHDLKVFDKNGGTIEDDDLLLLQLSGDNAGGSYRQRLFRYDEQERAFREATGEALRVSAGNYQAAAIADFNRDGCTDMAWAGFTEPDPAPTNPDILVRGTPDQLVFQRRTPSDGCTGTFYVATYEPGLNGEERYPARSGGQRHDMNRDIDVLDFDDDNNPDLFVTNAAIPLAFTPANGTNLGDRLLLNRQCPNGEFGCFVDESWRLGTPATFYDPHNATTICDVNGDGREDILSAAELGSSRLFIDVGETSFVDESLDRGVGTFLTSFAHDVACHDWTRPGGGPPDGYVDLVFGVRGQRKNVLLVNKANTGAHGPGYFVDGSHLLPDVEDTTSGVAVCDLEDDGVPEVLFANGDVNDLTAQANRVLRFDGTRFTDADRSLHFDFTPPAGIAAVGPAGGVSEVVTCVSLDDDSTVDLVMVGNAASGRTWLYFKQ